MVFDNYVWSGDALWIAIGTITPVLLIGGAAPVVDDGGVDLEDCGCNHAGAKLW